MNMDPAKLQDRVHRGLNAAARAVGADTDAYRPSGASEPLAPRNRFLRLRAAFTSRDGKFAHPECTAMHFGMASSMPPTRGPATIWCKQIRSGSSLPTAAAAGAVRADQPHRLILAPCRAVEHRREHLWWRHHRDERNTARRTGRRACLVRPDRAVRAPICLATVRVLTGPFCCRHTPDVILLPSDLMTDDLGRNAVVAAAELTDLGWRMTMKQATT